MTTATEAMQSMAALGARTDIPESPRTILVADDEHLVATGIVASLSELGYDVIGPAPDGETAIEMCREHAPDLALLDIRMPRMDGIDAANVIYEQLGIPVVIFSAYSDRDYVDKGNRVGIFNYLLKPVARDQLRVGVSVAWGRYRRHVEQDGEIADLKQRLENRKVIEQAKWIIVNRRSISEPEAMRLLQRQARNNRRPLVEVAQGVIENEELFG